MTSVFRNTHLIDAMQVENSQAVWVRNPRPSYSRSSCSEPMADPAALLTVDDEACKLTSAISGAKVRKP